jgi:hypothetical protein
LPVSLPSSSGSAGGGDDHVQRRGTTATVGTVIVVDQVLIIGVGMHRLDVSADNAEAIVERLEHRGDGVGRAARGRDDAVIGGEHAVVDAVDAVVDAVDDVLDAALGRSGQQHLRGARALEVLTEARLVLPDAGVVDDQRVPDAVALARVVHR